MQRLSANVQGLDSGGGIQGSIPIGGTNNTALTTTDADLIYSFTIEFKDASDVVQWMLGDGGYASPTVRQTGGGTDAVISGGASYPYSFDINGVIIPTVVTIVAIYYESLASNVGNITVDSSADEFGDFIFTGGDSTARSCLLVPRKAATSSYVDFSCSGAAKLKVVCLAKD
jgi:hypothetical protein